MAYFQPPQERPRHVKRFLTMRDIEDAAADGCREILHVDDLVITDAAREAAHDLGVAIVKPDPAKQAAAKPATPPPASAPPSTTTLSASPPPPVPYGAAPALAATRSEAHTSELQSLMRISSAVSCYPRDLHVLTHSFPTRRSSDLGRWLP